MALADAVDAVPSGAHRAPGFGDEAAGSGGAVQHEPAVPAFGQEVLCPILLYQSLAGSSRSLKAFFGVVSEDVVLTMSKVTLETGNACSEPDAFLLVPSVKLTRTE
ncbi:hypothetical protein [Arthrobacter sp. ISL-65]|uniref:hypothetical protein n=1 Tax=Arthrobacter sp. ISL-65 TaxID=2819112 RepID=UPI001BEB8E39|nr:hypothetical protein [Arthrobacter sp. ISL-65]MBT2547249.1 hypothetical protein [Arthrobacter sp. ISL-65]